MIIQDKSNHHTYIKMDESREICVRCGYQEPPASFFKDRSYKNILHYRLAWHPEYKMGMCYWCETHYPEYIEEGMTSGQIPEDIAGIGEDAWWARLMEDDSEQTSSTKTYFAPNLFLQDMKSKYGKYFTHKYDEGELVETPSIGEEARQN